MNFNCFWFLVNPDNTIGAVGFTTMIAPFMYPITLIKIDERTGEHVRDRNGVCVKAKPGNGAFSRVDVIDRE
jgi:solute carrier family 27 fatty acid transporter 1/4